MSDNCSGLTENGSSYKVSVPLVNECRIYSLASPMVKVAGGREVYVCLVNLRSRIGHLTANGRNK